ncbi:APH domain-containing protein [Favolaschia claudopus]|uniref:APH domain-containing protein n=1 Tax=Favolaschia claudopus TaxID=2862362 RepID=A0AAW0CPK2_9AGAR
MPTITRLLLLAFVGLSVHVQAAPLPEVAAAVDVGGNFQVDHVASFNFDSNYDDIERRALKKPGASKPVKPANPVKPAKPVTQPAPKPSTPARTPQKSSPSPAPVPVKAPTTSPPPAKIPVSKSKPSQASTSSKPAPSKVANPILKLTVPPHAPKQACAISKRATKHFTKTDAPQSLSIEISGTKFSLTQSTSQGNNAVVYQDSDGDFAKTPLTGSLEKEAQFTDAVGQLKAHGEDTCTGTEWMITPAAQGKVFNQTPAFLAVKSSEDDCLALADTAAGLAAAKAKSIFDATVTGGKGIVHGDLNAGNIFFDDQVSQILTLIDWGSAAKKASFPNTIATGQARVSFNSFCK